MHVIAPYVKAVSTQLAPAIAAYRQVRTRVDVLTAPLAAKLSPYTLLLAVLVVILGFNWATYLLHQIFLDVFCSWGQDLKKKYNAKWALVTGASSGIGKSIAMALADQGLNVVLVALPDPMFDDTFAEIKKKYPKCSFKKVECDLGDSSGSYLKVIEAATARLNIQILFNNAGYIKWGFFVKTSLGSQSANLECNTTSAMKLSHLFVTKMVTKGLPGCVVFTSSAAAAIPSPFSVLYASTKSFLSAFGASLAAEVKSKGIDVCVIHPSPVATRFYDAATVGTAMLDFFAQFAVTADTLPKFIFGAIGRTVWRDVGMTAIGFRLMTKFLDYNFLAVMTAATAHTMKDYQENDAL